MDLAKKIDSLEKLMENGIQCEGIQNFEQEMIHLKQMKSRMNQVHELLTLDKIKELYFIPTPPEDCVNLMKCILILL